MPEKSEAVPSVEKPAGASPAESTEAPTAEPEKAASTKALPKSDLSGEEQSALGQLMLDLRWLITAGYVTEYGDGRLFAPPPMPESKKEVSDPQAPIVSAQASTETEAIETETPEISFPSEDSAETGLK